MLFCVSVRTRAGLLEQQKDKRFNLSAQDEVFMYINNDLGQI